MKKVVHIACMMLFRSNQKQAFELFLSAMWRDLKYFLAYISPVAAALGIYYGGIWSPGALYVGFVVIPFLEFFLPARTDRVDPAEEKQRNENKFFDWLLYIHLPILYVLIFMFIYRIGHTDVTSWEIIGMTGNIGVMLGSFGINVAHELGHRSGGTSRWIARLLLVPSFYTHFTIEHNLGHHRHVGTPEDPATARIGETLYAFWWKSVTGSFRNAWKLERERLRKTGKQFISLSNELMIGVLLQLIYLTCILFFAGRLAGLVAVFAGVFGFLLLETVNYIEHYGLVRKKLPSGHYETVEAFHSWNSDHELGRIFLYELTRHADHHYRTNRHYQILRHLDGAPQLPTGYPGTMLLALVPPLWRKVIDWRVLKNYDARGSLKDAARSYSTPKHINLSHIHL